MSDNTKDLLLQIRSNGEQVATQLARVADVLERIDANTRKASKSTEEMGKASKSAGDGLDHFHRHAQISASSCQNFGDVIKLAQRELGNFSFSMWKIAMNTTLWTGILGGAAASVNKLVETGSKFAEMRQGFEGISMAAGHLGSEVLEKVKISTRGLITEMQIMKSYNTAISLGIKTTADEFAVLTGAAVKMSKVMGTDLNYAMNSLTTGLARQSIRVLDNIGVTFKQKEAYEWYAEKQGKLVKQLDEEEKKTAFVTYAIMKLKENAEKSGETIGTLGERFTQARVQITDMVQKTLAYVVTNASAIGSGKELGDVVKELGDKIWASRDKIVHFIISAVNMGTTIVQLGGKVYDFIIKYYELIKIIAEAYVFMRLIGILQTLVIAMNAVGDAALLNAFKMKTATIASFEFDAITGKVTRLLPTMGEQFRVLGGSIVRFITSFTGITTILVVGGVALNNYLSKVSDLDEALKDLDEGALRLTFGEKLIATVGALGDAFRATALASMALSEAYKGNIDTAKIYMEKSIALSHATATGIEDVWTGFNKRQEEQQKKRVGNADTFAKQYAGYFAKGDFQVIEQFKQDAKRIEALAPDKFVKEYFDKIQAAVKKGGTLTKAVLSDVMAQVQSDIMLSKVKPEGPEPGDSGKTPWQILGLPSPEKMSDYWSALQSIITDGSISVADKMAAMDTYADKVRARFAKVFPDAKAIMPVNDMIDALNGMGEALGKLPDTYKDLNYEQQKYEFNLRQVIASGQQFTKDAADMARAHREEEQNWNSLVTKVNAYKSAWESFVEKGESPAIKLANDYGQLVDKAEEAYEAHVKYAESLLDEEAYLEELATANTNYALTMDELKNSTNGVLAAFAEVHPVMADFIMGMQSGIKTIGQQMYKLGQDTQGFLANAFAKTFTSIITHTKSVKEAFKDLGKAILSFVIEALAKLAAQALINFIAGKIQRKMAHTEEAAQKPAQWAVNAAASVAAIPYVGWAMAPAIFATAYAMGIAAMAPGLAAKEGMWNVPGLPDTAVPATLHGRELVAPAPEAEKIRNFVDRVTSPTASQSTSVSVNLSLGNNGEPIIVNDQESLRSLGRMLADHLSPEIQRQIDRGQMRLDTYGIR